MKRYVSSAITNNEKRKLATQTRQRTHLYTAQADLGYANYQYWDMWSPGHFRASNILDASLGASKVKIMGMEQTVTMHNQSPLKIHLRIVKVRCNRAYTGAIADGPLGMIPLNQATDPKNVPFADFTIGHTFRRYYSILSNKEAILDAGATMVLKRSTYSKSGRIYTGELEGQINNWAYPGMYTTIVMFSSVPYVNFTADPLQVGTALCTLASTNAIKVTYQVIEDNLPTSIGQAISLASIAAPTEYNTGGNLTDNSTGLHQPPIRTVAVPPTFDVEDME